MLSTAVFLALLGYRRRVESGDAEISKAEQLLAIDRVENAAEAALLLESALSRGLSGDDRSAAARLLKSVRHSRCGGHISAADSAVAPAEGAPLAVHRIFGTEVAVRSLDAATAPPALLAAVAARAVAEAGQCSSGSERGSFLNAPDAETVHLRRALAAALSVVMPDADGSGGAFWAAAEVVAPGGYATAPSAPAGAVYAGVLALALGSLHLDSNTFSVRDPRPGASTAPRPRHFGDGIAVAAVLEPGHLLVHDAGLQVWAPPNLDEEAARVVLHFAVLPQAAGGISLPGHEWTAAVMVRNAGLAEAQLAALAQEASIRGEGVQRSNRGGWQSDTAWLGRQRSAAAQAARRAAVRAVASYIRDGHNRTTRTGAAAAGLHRLEVFEAWLLATGAGHSNAPHLHPRATVSGVLYLACPADGGGALIYHEPRRGPPPSP